MYYLRPPEEWDPPPPPDEDLPDEPEKEPPDDPEDELLENEPEELCPDDDGLLNERELPPELSALLREGIEYDLEEPPDDGALYFLCMLLNELDLSPDPDP